jgi:hypothetical protein
VDQLPADFAESLARVLEPGQDNRVAEIIEAATRLDDKGLQIFLERFAARVRKSPTPVTVDELFRFLRDATRRGQSSAT